MMGRQRNRRRRGGWGGGVHGTGEGAVGGGCGGGIGRCERPPLGGAREGEMRAAAAGSTWRLESRRPRHMADRLRVLGFTGCVTGCRCNPSRSPDPQILPVQGGIPGVIAVSLRCLDACVIFACNTTFAVIEGYRGRQKKE
jgi:hypothetical protein